MHSHIVRIFRISWAAGPTHPPEHQRVHCAVVTDGEGIGLEVVALEDDGKQGTGDAESAQGAAATLGCGSARKKNRANQASEKFRRDQHHC